MQLVFLYILQFSVDGFDINQKIRKVFMRFLILISIASFFSNSSTFRLLLILLIFNYQLAPNSSSKMHMYLVDLFSSIFWTLYREAIQKKKKKDTLDKRLFYYKTSTFLCYSWDYRYVLLVPIVTCYLYFQKNLWSSSRHSKTIIYET